MAVVGELAAGPAFTTSLDASVVDAAICMRDNGIGDVIVVDGEGKVAGILTDRDVTVRVVAERRDPETTKVADVCTHDPVVIDAVADVEEAERVMREHIVRRVPVVDDERRPLGMLSLEDLAGWGYIDDHELRDVLKTIARAYWRRSAAVP